MSDQATLTQVPVTAGTFCWNELATRDSSSATTFYTALFGWTADEMEVAGVPYTMWKIGDQPIGGMMTMTDDWPAEVPDHWMSYIAVDDVDATCGRVPECGGDVCVDPTDIAGIGRFAVLTDPTGGAVSIFSGGVDVNPSGTGSFCWNELLTTDAAVTGAFYTSLFGWTTRAGTPMPSCEYTIFHCGETCCGGMMTIDPAWGGAVRPGWLGYVQVDDIEAAIDRATSLGGTLLHGPADVAGIGWFSIIADPTGTPFALFKNTGACEDASCGCE